MGFVTISISCDTRTYGCSPDDRYPDNYYRTEVPNFMKSPRDQPARDHQQIIVQRDIDHSPHSLALIIYLTVEDYECPKELSLLYQGK